MDRRWADCGAGKVVRGGGYGVFRDILLGIVGAFIGGIVMSGFGGDGPAGFAGSIVLAAVGATILGGVVRAVAAARISLSEVNCCGVTPALKLICTSCQSGLNPSPWIASITLTNDAPPGSCPSQASHM